MSGIYIIENELISFADFIELEESIKPRDTEYGTDSKNGKWYDSEHWKHTFFSHTPEHHVLVALNKTSGELAFSSHHGKFSNNIEKHYDDSRSRLGDSMKVINKVFHVGLKGANEFGHNVIRTKPADKKLDSLYSGIFTNKFAKKHLGDAGFEYKGKMRDFHTLIRK